MDKIFGIFFVVDNNVENHKSFQTQPQSQNLALAFYLPWAFILPSKSAKLRDDYGKFSISAFFRQKCQYILSRIVDLKEMS